MVKLCGKRATSTPNNGKGYQQFNCAAITLSMHNTVIIINSQSGWKRLGSLELLSEEGWGKGVSI